MFLDICKGEIMPGTDYERMVDNCYTAQGMCYNKGQDIPFEEKEKKLMSRIKAGHESLLEHVNFSAHIVCDRACSHEIVRHRHCAFTQSSTRYINYAQDGCTFIIPEHEMFDPLRKAITLNEKLNLKQLRENVALSPPVAWWLDHKSSEEFVYTHLVNQEGMPLDIARGTLDNDLKTSLVLTTNIREWRHIFKLRVLGTTGKPHPNIKKVMSDISKQAKEYLPCFFFDMPELGNDQ